MKPVNKKTIFIFLFLLAILSSFLFANKKYNLVSRIIKREEKQSENLDNWEISTVFYDSAVDNGLTPLTEINWDASDGSYLAGETRTITVQINYSNTNTVKEYGIHNLKISIPDFIATGSMLGMKKVLGANINGNTGYDWDGSIDNTNHVITFYNAIEIQEETNFEGSIRIVYSMTPGSEETTAELGENECLHTLEQTFKASIYDYISYNNQTFLAESNTISFNYRRLYIHEWTKYQYNLTKEAFPVDYYDRLENPQDYIWVNYQFTTIDKEYSNRINIVLYTENGSYYVIEDELPEGAVAYINGEKQTPYEGNKYRFNYKVSKNCCNSALRFRTYKFSAVVGYPKSIYNESNNNMNITNTASLYVTYEGENELSFQKEASIDVDLNDYINPSGNIYTITKEVGYNVITSGESIVATTYPKYYQAILGDDSFINGNLFAYNVRNNIMYTGTPMTVEIGDDYLWHTNPVTKLEDEDYYLNTLRINSINNVYNESLLERYNWKLYVRDAGSTTYRLYTENLTKGIITFDSDEKIAAWYITSEDVNESIKTYIIGYYNFVKQDISTSGRLYNSAYQNVYFKDGDDLILQNPVVEQTNEDLAEYDLATYGRYLQRGSIYDSWTSFKIRPPKGTFTVSLYPYQHNYFASQDEENKLFRAKYQLVAELSGSSDPNDQYNEAHNSDYDPETHTLKTIYYYALLPKGMSVGSSKQEIINSIHGHRYVLNGHVMTTDFVEIDADDVAELIKETITEDDITITENWKGTGQTLLKIVAPVGEDGVYLFEHCGVHIYVEFEGIVTYDNYEEYGSSYTLELFVDVYNTLFTPYYYYAVSDSLDIDEDGKKYESFGHDSYTGTIISAISSHQDVQTNVQTDLNNFKTGLANASLGANYSYKLRVRVGENNVKNLVVYESIENYAKDLNQNFILASRGEDSWQGEFLGVDTSYAENQGYNVRVWYSESEQPGSLSDDASWYEYNDSVDKSSVKSLAFEYLDENGDSATIPSNSLTYVLVNMKAPDEEYSSYAYNGCWTEWNAIDSVTGQPVDFITGINSNIVKVSLPMSEPPTTDLTVTKVWVDNSNAYGTRPSDVTYYIMPNGDDTDITEVTFTGTGDTWTHTVTLPKYDSNDEEIIYTMEEADIDGYEESCDGYTCTNTVTDTDTITISKIWQDSSNTYNTRPNSVTIQLKQNDVDYEEVTLNGTGDTWTKEVEVPMYDSNGVKYTYSIEEASVDGYLTSCSDFTCTNTVTGDDTITVKKVWLDNSNAYYTRPNSATLYVMKNGEYYETVTLSGTEALWTQDLDVEKFDENGDAYVYTVDEDDVPNYSKYCSELRCINTLVGDRTITVEKIWKDNSNAYGTRPETVTFYLKRNNIPSRTITFSGTGDHWEESIVVPRYDTSGVKILYSITEPSVSGYTTSCYLNDCTNTLSANINITITKNWVDNSNAYGTRPDSITIQLLQNGNTYQDVTINGTGDTWTKNVQVPKYDSEGVEINYSIAEPSIDEYATSCTGFTCTNTLSANDTLTINKVWKDNSNAYGTRPNNVAIQIKQNGTNYQEVTLNGTGDTWTKDVEVPKYDSSGNKYSYSISEPSVTNYATSCSDLTCVNTLTGNGSIAVNKVWVDNNNAYNTRPENITVQIKQNDSNYQEVTLTGTGNTWSKSVDVPMYDNNGVKYTYTAAESSVTGYLTSCNDLTCTNTLTGNETITVNKIWVDNSNAYGTRPNSVVLHLKQNNNTYQDVDLTGTGNSWSKNVEVPKYDANGVKYSYTVNESTVNGYSTSCNDLSCTNTLAGDETITINKVWKDNSNAYGTRPTSVAIQIKQNGTDYQSVTINGVGDTWTKDLVVPKYDSNGVKYTYSASEPSVNGYSSTCSNLTCTNTLTGNDTITVNKVWVDNSNAYGTRPDSIAILLNRNDSFYQAVVLLTENSNTWSKTVEVPLYDSDGVKYTYTVDEASVTNYVTSCSNFTCTNTLTGADTITLNKSWVDNSNEYNTRPENVILHLKQNNNNYQDVTITGTGNTWSKNVEVPKYDGNGVKYSYTVSESTVNGYTTSCNDLSCTNVLSGNNTITVNKVWKDNSNAYGTRPDSVTIQVKQNGDNYQVVTLNGSGNTWTKILEVPMYDDTGAKFTYSITEPSVTDYATSCSELTCTNTLTGTDSITINKSWVDNSNAYDTRPNNIKIQVKQNGSDYQEVTLSGNGNTWTKTVEVPKYDSDGIKYTYTVSEPNVTNYATSCNDLTCTNTLTGNETITLNKKWIDNSNAYDTRPGNVVLHLKQNNNTYQDVTLTGTGNTWSKEVEVPKYDGNGVKYTYTVSETAINGYSTSCNELTCTNTLTGNENIAVSKVWKDNSNAYGTRPTNVIIQVKQNDSNYQELTLSGTGNSWSQSIEVPTYDATGTKYTYTVVEPSVSGYTTSCSGYTCTNTLTGNDNITVQKKWVDNDNTYGTRPDSITIQVKQNGTNYQEVTLNGTGNTWSKTIEVPKYDTDGVKYSYTVSESAISGYSTSCDDLTCTNTLTGNDSITISKIWKDSSNAYGTRPNSVTIQVKQNDSNYQTVTLSGNGDTWSNVLEVPKYDSTGVEYTYTVTEPSVTNYVTSCSNLTCTNTLTGNETITINKSWIDNSNAYSTRPDSVTLHLKQNNSNYQDVALTGTGNNWSKTIEVPKYDSNGVKYTYSVSESTVNGYNTSCSELTCTNTITDNESITVNKVWKDNNNSYGTRPNNVTIQVKQNGSDYQEVTLNGSGNTWSKAIEVPMYDTNGAKYTYTIEEGTITHYGSVEYNQSTYTVTNTLKENEEIELTKVWKDNSNELNTRPSNVTYYLVPNEDTSSATEVTFDGTGDTWTYDASVPKYDSNGVKIDYTIYEKTIEPANGYKYLAVQDGNKFTNTLNKEITITKNWVDNSNAYLTRPSNITVKIYQNGSYYKDLNITGNYSTNTWTGTLTVPVYDSSNDAYTYTASEISVDNYTTVCNDLTCTNTLTGNESIKVHKKWVDNDNTYNTRPDSVTIHLKQNNNNYQNITLTGTGSTWDSDSITVPKYDTNGVKYTYAIEEDTVSSYGLVSYNQDTYTVTNTLKETMSITITKTWVDNSNAYGTRPQELKINLLQNGNNYQEVTLTGTGDTWSTIVEVPKYDDNQTKYVYTIKEVTDNLDGDYSEITYSETELAVTNQLMKNIVINVSKTWDDHDDEYNTRPETLTIQLLRDGNDYQEIELIGDTNTWTQELEVPVYDETGRKNLYTIKEIEELERYGNITYDQTNFSVINELTEVPTVTLYFTVTNVYTDPITGELVDDEDGLRELLIKHNIDPDSDYSFDINLKNVETEEVYEGTLSSNGILEFEEIPYGDYQAVEGEDEIFEFVSMESISQVLGVSFTPGPNGGTISIRPTGDNIIYGANIINRITVPIEEETPGQVNPNTNNKNVVLLVVALITSAVLIAFAYFKMNRNKKLQFDN